MKGDFSRRTFDDARHYAAVTMQQGRVQLDADWNEQVEITRHRAETETLDTVGRCGGPLHAAAFGVTTLAALPKEESDYVKSKWKGFKEGAGDFLLSAGRYYVDGILVENEHPVPFGMQPDLPDPRPLPADGGNYLLYLDVWERHLTALEEPSVPAQGNGAVPLREIALGGPDTASRVRVVWQVRWVKATEPTCVPVPGEYTDATAPSNGQVRMRAAAPKGSSDPCVVPAGFGYRGLENQLYRVEIHDAGAAVSHTSDTGEEVKGWDAAKRTLTLAQPLAGLAVNSAVELYYSAPATGADPSAGTVAYVTQVDTPGTQPVVTLNAAFTAPDGAQKPRLRVLKATAKWSRDNGVVVAKVRSIDVKTREVVVESFGVDDVLSIQVNQWVELFDDANDLAGTPGGLYQVESRNDATRTLVLRTTPTALGGQKGVDPGRNPRIRRWDGLAAVKTDLPGGYQELESGVQVQFLAGPYHTGDWWNAAARTATAESQSGTLEWPLGLDGLPELRGPAGIVHHYCRLGVVNSPANGPVKLLDDCRCLFAPATELNSLEYVSGAGQEAMPDIGKPKQRVELALPLVVGIPNAHCRTVPAEVRFKVTRGKGSLSSQPKTHTNDDELKVALGNDGLAIVYWWLGTDDLNDDNTVHQLVEARLLENGTLVQLPVIFNASLSVAHRVSYDPSDCEGLKGRITVQSAIDRLARAASLHAAGGDGQEVMPGKPLTRKLRVILASDCGPIAGNDTVEWTVVGGSGTLNGNAGPVLTSTDAGGFAEVRWDLDPATHWQEVVARISPATGFPQAVPIHVYFSATLSTAGEVAYTPGGECEMKGAGVETVQEALDWLCTHRGHGGCSVTVGTAEQRADFRTLKEALELLEERKAISICLLPGVHEVQEELEIRLGPGQGAVRITGNGVETVIHLIGEGKLRVGPLGSFILRDLVVDADTSRPIEIRECLQTTIENCRIIQELSSEPMITVRQVFQFRLAGCFLKAHQPLIPFIRPGEDTLPEDRPASGPVVPAGGDGAPMALPPDEERLRFIQRSIPVDAIVLLDTAPIPGFQETSLAIPSITLENNLIDGYVRLYGDGTLLSNNDPPDDLPTIGAMVRGNPATGERTPLLQNGGTLTLRGNQLLGMRLDKKAVTIVRNGGTPFRRCILTENTFILGGSMVLAAHLDVHSNEWGEAASGDLLHGVAMTAMLVGNTGIQLQSGGLWVWAARKKSPAETNAVNLVPVTYT